MQFRGIESMAANIQYVGVPLLALVAAGIARLVIHRYLVRWEKRKGVETITRLVGQLESASTPLLLIAALYLITYALPLSPEILVWTRRGLAILAILIVVPALSKITALVLELLARQQPALTRYLQPLGTLSTAAFALAGISVALQILDVNFTQQGIRFVRIAGIVLGCYVALKIVHLAVARMESLVDDRDDGVVSEAEKRAQTLGRILKSSALVIVVAIGVMMLLDEFGMNIMPIITGAGLAGLAFGFGAQNLVRDVISGFFIILENQVRVGDVAVINGTGGLVEAINLRTIVLRDLQGTVHIFPNGEITQVSNMTKEWSRYVIDVGVAYKEDVDRVMKILEGIGQDLCEDENFRALILDKLEVLGVDDFGESQVTIKVMIKTLPLKQWTVGRELRRRIKNTFDKEGIEIPFPHLSLYFGEASKPFEVLLNQSQNKSAAVAG